MRPTRSPRAEFRIALAGVAVAILWSAAAPLVAQERPGARPEPSANASVSSEELLRDTDRLRGTVLADLDPRIPGSEAATAGYSRRATVLGREDGAWTAPATFEDEAGFHHATSARIEGLGPTLFVCGYSGRLLAFRPVR